MADSVITSETVEAYLQCPRKAYLLLRGEPKAVPHQYQLIVKDREDANRSSHRSRLASEGGGVVARTPDDLAGGRPVILDAVLAVDGLEARCDALMRTGSFSGLGAFSYEPLKVVGTPRIDRQQSLGLAYLGYLLNEVQHRLPAAGTLVQDNNRPRRVKLVGKYKEVRRVIEVLQIWTRESSEDAPPIVINKHCPICPFRDCCREQAEKEDNLSLLDRMTPRLLKKYHSKGIFTINQLSYLFKPKRNRKNFKAPGST